MAITASTRVQPVTVDELWRRVAEGDLAARNEVVERNLPLVRYVVGRLNVTVTGTLDYEDLVSFGQIGLIDAVKRYDHTRGIAFSTYAIRRIRGAIMDELRSLDWAPRSVRSKQRRLRVAATELAQRLGRDPSLEEMANLLGLSVAEVEGIVAEVDQTYTRSLDEPANGRGDLEDVREVVDCLASPGASPADHGEMLHHRQRIARAMPLLGQRTRTFLALYYFENWTFSEIGDLLGVTESRVCQVHTAAMQELRATV